MYFRVNLKMKKPTLCCCFTWIVFIKLNFTVAFLLIRKTWDDQSGFKLTYHDSGNTMYLSFFMIQFSPTTQKITIPKLVSAT